MFRKQIEHAEEVDNILHLQNQYRKKYMGKALVNSFFAVLLTLFFFPFLYAALIDAPGLFAFVFLSFLAGIVLLVYNAYSDYCDIYKKEIIPCILDVLLETTRKEQTDTISFKDYCRVSAKKLQANPLFLKFPWPEGKKLIKGMHNGAEYVYYNGIYCLDYGRHLDNTFKGMVFMFPLGTEIDVEIAISNEFLCGETKSLYKKLRLEGVPSPNLYSVYSTDPQKAKQMLTAPMMESVIHLIKTVDLIEKSRPKFLIRDHCMEVYIYTYADHFEPSFFFQPSEEKLNRDVDLFCVLMGFMDAVRREII